MALVKPHNRWFIVVTYLAALLLSVFPLYYEARWLRPEFLVLCVIFWTLRLPQQISLLWVLACGVLLDILEGVMLGQHALALIVVVYLCLLTQQRMQHYASWQQALAVGLMVVVHQLIDNWVHSFQGGAAQDFEFLMPALTSAMLWPVVVILLDRSRITFRVS